MQNIFLDLFSFAFLSFFEALHVYLAVLDRECVSFNHVLPFYTNVDGTKSNAIAFKLWSILAYNNLYELKQRFQASSKNHVIL